MIRNLDNTIKKLLTEQAPSDSLLKSADISFDLPDADWRGSLTTVTVNCYLYDIRQNLELRTNEMLLQRSTDNTRAIWRTPPTRIDCAYCITAWSAATAESVFEEHGLLSDILLVLLKNPTIPAALLQGDLINQIPPYPTVIASQEGVKNQPEFWRALDQQLKPSLNYIVTLAMMLDEPLPELPRVVEQVTIGGGNLDEVPN